VKHISQQVVDANFNSSISAASECYKILPDVSEGTDGHERIGNKIKPKYLVVKGKLHYSGVDQGTYFPPNTARLLILTQKNVKCNAQISSTVDPALLLKDNVGTDAARPYNGTNFDNLAPINKELFNVLMDKKVKLRAQIEKQLGNNNTVLAYGNQKTITWSVKIKCPAELTFDDTNGNTPNNFAPFFCMGGVNDDSTTGPWITTTPYHCTVLSTLYFYDA